MKVRYLPAKFSGHRPCSSGVIIILVCHVISKDYVIIGSCDFIGRSPSRYVTFLLSLVAKDTVAEES